MAGTGFAVHTGQELLGGLEDHLEDGRGSIKNVWYIRIRKNYEDMFSWFIRWTFDASLYAEVVLAR